MTRFRTLLAVAATTALLSGCGAASQTGLPGKETSHLSVDSPQLRAAKQRAGVESCPVPSHPVSQSAAALPDLTLPCLGGGPAVNLARLRGPMVINLFAQWCGPCRSEMPYYQVLHEKAGHRLTVLGIDYADEQPARALDLVEQTGVTYPLLADPAGDLRARLHVRGRAGIVPIRGLPGLLLVDGRGRVTSAQFRVVTSYAQLRGIVRHGLHVPLPR